MKVVAEGISQPHPLSDMTIPHIADVEAIVEKVKRKTLDFNTFRTHVVNKTVNQYYSSVLSEIASDLLAIPVEREFHGFEQLDPKEDMDDVYKAVVQLSSILSNWFLKDRTTVEQDLAQTIQDTSFEDVREARFLRLHQMLN